MKLWNKQATNKTTTVLLWLLYFNGFSSIVFIWPCHCRVVGECDGCLSSFLSLRKGSWTYPTEANRATFLYKVGDWSPLTPFWTVWMKELWNFSCKQVKCLEALIYLIVLCFFNFCIKFVLLLKPCCKTFDVLVDKLHNKLSSAIVYGKRNHL